MRKSEEKGGISGLGKSEEKGEKGWGVWNRWDRWDERKKGRKEGRGGWIKRKWVKWLMDGGKSIEYVSMWMRLWIGSSPVGGCAC